MYKEETTTSQQLILQIIHRVAVHSPTVVFGFYPHFTDDSKFPITSLKDRAPILTALTEQSEVIEHISCVIRKPVLDVSNKVLHKPGCTTTEDG